MKLPKKIVVVFAKDLAETLVTQVLVYFIASVNCMADALKDTVFDLTHNLPLNVVGNLLKELITSGKLDAKSS